MRIDLSTCRDADLLSAEVRRLRSAITAFADQDATLSVCDGNVTVTMDATLTVEERAAVELGIELLVIREDDLPSKTGKFSGAAATLRGLLERL